MRRTSLWILALALIAGACSDDGGPKTYKPDELRVTVVSGDGQTAQVASAASASLSVSTAALLQSVPPGLEVLDRPLVVELVTEGGQRVMGSSVPSGMKAAWIVDEEGCGRPFHGDTDFNSEGRAENLWIRGTKAGVDCTMYAGRIVGGQAVIDSVFVAEFEPGDPARLSTEGILWAEPGESIDMGEPTDYYRFSATDAHGNTLERTLIVERYTPTWRIVGPRATIYDNCWDFTGDTVASGSGWVIPNVPPHDNAGYCVKLDLNGAPWGVIQLRTLTPEV